MRGKGCDDRRRAVVQGNFEKDKLDQDLEEGLEEERGFEVVAQPVEAPEDGGDEHD